MLVKSRAHKGTLLVNGLNYIYCLFTLSSMALFSCCYFLMFSTSQESYNKLSSLLNYPGCDYVFKILGLKRGLTVTRLCWQGKNIFPITDHRNFTLQKTMLHTVRDWSLIMGRGGLVFRVRGYKSQIRKKWGYIFWVDEKKGGYSLSSSNFMHCMTLILYTKKVLGKNKRNF
jgi:hypothetical protein